MVETSAMGFTAASNGLGEHTEIVSKVSDDPRRGIRAALLEADVSFERERQARKKARRRK